MNHFAQFMGIACSTVLLLSSGLRAGEIHDAVAAGDLFWVSTKNIKQPD